MLGSDWLYTWTAFHFVHVAFHQAEFLGEESPTSSSGKPVAIDVASTFREGDLVRVRNFRRGPRWFSATVLARTGPVSYRVSVVTPRGVCEWVRHRNHIVRAPDSDDLVITDADFRGDAPVTVNTSPTSTTELVEQPSAANQAAEQGRRYPQRQRRAPDRYGT
ncbi:hypothetical protein MTO96_044840 [Rhipicephalus appendiculatus]